MGWRARPSRRTASRSNPRPQPSEVERGALSRHGRLRRATASAGRASGWPRGCTRAPAPKPGFRSNGMARSAVATHCVAVEPTTPAFGGGARRAQPAWPAAPRDGERGMRERVAAGMQARACTEAGLSDEGDGALGGTRTHDPSLRRAVLYPTELRARCCHSRPRPASLRHVRSASCLTLGAQAAVPPEHAPLDQLSYERVLA